MNTISYRCEFKHSVKWTSEIGQLIFRGEESKD